MRIRLIQGVAEYKRLVERAELLKDISVAEEEIAAAEGVEHREAKQQLLGRLRR